MEEIPFGIIFSIGFALVGMLIQFAINKPKYDDDYDDEEDEIRGKYQKDDRNGKKLTGRRLKTRQSAEGKKNVMIKRILPGSSTESIRKSMKMMIR